MRSIPAGSTAVGTAQGDFFEATIYRTPDGEIAASVQIVDGARRRDLEADQMNSKIREAAGGVPDFYVINRLVED